MTTLVKRISLILITLLFISLFSVCYAKEHWAEQTYNDFITKGFISGDMEVPDLDTSIIKSKANDILKRFYANKESYFNDDKLVDRITREEACALFCKIMKLDLLEEVPNFVDAQLISVWARDYVYTAQKAELIVGYPDGTFRPLDDLTCAEFITMLSRVKGSGGKDEPELLELIDEEITNIEVGIPIYSSGEIRVIPVEDQLFLTSGDSFPLSIAFPQDVSNDDLIYKISNDKVLSFDEKTGYLSALASGDATLVFEIRGTTLRKDIKIKILQGGEKNEI